MEGDDQMQGSKWLSVTPGLELFIRPFLDRPQFRNLLLAIVVDGLFDHKRADTDALDYRAFDFHRLFFGFGRRLGRGCGGFYDLRCSGACCAFGISSCHWCFWAVARYTIAHPSIAP